MKQEQHVLSYDDLKKNLQMPYFLGRLLLDRQRKPADFEVLDVNEPFLRLAGIEKEHILGRKASDIFRWEHGEHFTDELTGAKAVAFREYSDELGLWLEGTAVSAGANRYTVFFSDISTGTGGGSGKTFREKLLTDELTALESAHRELKASEEKYRTLFQSLDEGFFVAEAMFDKNGRVTDIYHYEANEASVRILGKDFTGKRLTEIDPRYDRHWFEAFEEVVKTGENRRSTLYSTPDGIWADCFFFRIGGPGSRLVGNIFSDVTEKKSLTAALEESEKRYRELFENITEGFMIGELVPGDQGVPADYRVIEMNGAYSLLTGHRAQDTVGRLASQMHGLDAQDWIASIVDVARSGQPGQVTFYSAALTRHFECTVSPLTSGRFALSLRDATDRLRAEATILQRNTILRQINRVHEQAMLCTTEEELGQVCLKIVTEVTGSLLGMIGEVRGDAVVNDITMHRGFSSGMMMSSHGTRAMMKPIGFDPICQGIINGGVSIATNDVQSMLGGFQMPAGHPVMSSALGVPFIQNGKVLGLIAVAERPGGYTDNEREILEAITPTVLEAILRKRAEKDRERQAKELLRMQENLTAEMESLSRLHEINANFIRRDDIRSIYEDILAAAIDLTHADDGDIQFPDAAGQLSLAAVRHNSEPFRSHAHCVAGDCAPCKTAYTSGQRVILQATPDGCFLNGQKTDDFCIIPGISCIQSSPMFTSTGTLMGVLTTVYRQPHAFSDREFRVLDLLTREAADVAEREKTETELLLQAGLLAQQAVELEKKNKLITDFFINISHEFKTPLTILMLGVDLLDKKLQNRGGQDVAKNLAVMKQNSYRLGRLISNLLDITRLDAGFVELNWEEVDVVELARNLASSAALFARQKGLELRFDSDCEHMPFVTDSMMLERILLNLLSNAIKHTQPGGQIELRCRGAGGHAVFSVKDNGEGIPQDKQEIIFDRFRQVNTSLTRRSEGCGIGLALTKSLVELMGGKITFTSRVGIGSEFVVSLPKAHANVLTNGIEQSSLQLDKRVQMELSDISVDIV